VAKIAFDSQSYWKRRSDGTGDLTAVGHRSLGPEYNRFIYRRRLDVLQEYLERSQCDLRSLRVLDIGCGNGFYAEFWRGLGVKDYLGLDVSATAVAALAERFPGMRFECLDISEPNAAKTINGTFDIVTIFDVLYHIVSDKAAEEALHNVARLLDPNGTCIVFDQLAGQSFNITQHVRYRSESLFRQMMDNADLGFYQRQRLFLLLVPPLTGFKPLDITCAGIYMLLGFAMRGLPVLGRTIGSMLYRLDNALMARHIDWGNSEALFLRRKSACKLPEQGVM